MCWITEVIPQATSHVAGLIGALAANDVQDECITGDLLVLFHLDDVASLNVRPCHQLETFASLVEDKLLHRLLIHSVSSILQSSVMD